MEFVTGRIGRWALSALSPRAIRTGRRAAVAEPAVPVELPARRDAAKIRVGLTWSARWILPALQGCPQDRYDFAADVADCDVIVTGPVPAQVIMRLAATPCAVAVISQREAPAWVVAACLGAGASVFASPANATLVLAYLDVLTCSRTLNGSTDAR